MNEEKIWNVANTNCQNQMRRNINKREKDTEEKRSCGCAKEEILKWNIKNIIVIIIMIKTVVGHHNVTMALSRGMLLFFVPNFQCDMSFDWKMFEVLVSVLCCSFFSIMFFFSFFIFLRSINIQKGIRLLMTEFWYKFFLLSSRIFFVVVAWCCLGLRYNKYLYYNNRLNIDSFSQ